MTCEGHQSKVLQQPLPCLPDYMQELEKQLRTQHQEFDCQTANLRDQVKQLEESNAEHKVSTITAVFLDSNTCMPCLWPIRRYEYYDVLMGCML